MTTAQMLRISVCCWLAWCSLFVANQALSQTREPAAILPLPALQSPLFDATQSLSEQEVQKLTQQLHAIEATLGSKIVVLLLATTAPETLESFAHRAASQWKLGRQGSGEGVLWVIAKDDRRMRMETSRAVEGVLPDVLIARILDHEVQPHLKAGDYAAGIEAGLSALAQHLASESTPDTHASPETDPSAPETMPQDATLPVLLWLVLMIFVAYAATHTFGFWWGMALLHALYTAPCFLLFDSLALTGIAAALVSGCVGVAFAWRTPSQPTLIGSLGTPAQALPDSILDSWESDTPSDADSTSSASSYDTGGGGSYDTGGGGSYAGGGASGSW